MPLPEVKDLLEVPELDVELRLLLLKEELLEPWLPAEKELEELDEREEPLLELRLELELGLELELRLLLAELLEEELEELCEDDE